jgi:hypothetical protein
MFLAFLVDDILYVCCVENLKGRDGYRCSGSMELCVTDAGSEDGRKTGMITDMFNGGFWY